MTPSQNRTIEHAFILAAGIGARLRPYTDDRPKPLVPVWGRPIIDRTLDMLAGAGVKTATINTHYMAGILEENLRKRRALPQITFSRETELLDTGGGVKKALDTMEGQAFYLISGDALWTDGPVPALTRLAQAWDESKMDLLMLLQPVARMRLTKGVGDYNIESGNRAVRSRERTGTHMFTSIRICHPRLFDASPPGKFSFLDLMDKAEAAGRLYALEHDADWHHISTPAERDAVEACYEPA